MPLSFLYFLVLFIHENERESEKGSHAETVNPTGLSGVGKGHPSILYTSISVQVTIDTRGLHACCEYRLCSIRAT